MKKWGDIVIIVLGENMNKQGFTLVELLAVIVILSLIALITVPAITGIIKSGKETLSEAQMRNIELGARNWATDPENLSSLTDGEECVTLPELQAGGYVDMEIKNPKNGKELEASVLIERDGKNLVYTVFPTMYCS